MKRKELSEVATDTAKKLETDTPKKIDFDAAVHEAKQLLKQISSNQIRLGELADKLEPKYGARTLGRFAAELGIAACTVERYRSVYRAWKEIPALGPELMGELSYSVARELAIHPDRAKIIKAKPTITKKEAAQLARAYKDKKVAGPTAQPTAQPATDDAHAATTQWHRKVHMSADQAIKAATPHLDSWMKEFDAGDFSQIDIPPGLLDVVNQAAGGWAKIAECIEQLHQRQREHETPPQPAAEAPAQPALN